MDWQIDELASKEHSEDFKYGGNIFFVNDTDGNYTAQIFSPKPDADRNMRIHLFGKSDYTYEGNDEDLKALADREAVSEEKWPDVFALVSDLYGAEGYVESVYEDFKIRYDKFVAEYENNPDSWYLEYFIQYEDTYYYIRAQKADKAITYHYKDGTSEERMTPLERDLMIAVMGKSDVEKMLESREKEKNSEYPIMTSDIEIFQGK